MDSFAEIYTEEFDLNNGKRKIKYLDNTKNPSTKYDSKTRYMLILEFDKNGEKFKEELKLNPYCGDYEHYKKDKKIKQSHKDELDINNMKVKDAIIIIIFIFLFVILLYFLGFIRRPEKMLGWLIFMVVILALYKLFSYIRKKEQKKK